MELKKVKALLTDYYEGKTSREEEALLTEFFIEGKVPSELEADRMLFLSIDESAHEELPDDQFDEKLFAEIEKVDNKKEDGRVRRMLYAISGVAAGILLLAGSYFFIFEKEVDQFVYADTEYTDQETMLAYEEAKGALLLVSQVMNTGTEQLGALSKMSDAANDLKMINKFHQGTNELQVLSKFDETVTGLRSGKPGENN